MESLKPAFTIDYRSLRLFRLLLGVGVFLEAVSFSKAAPWFFVDDGLYPRNFPFVYGRPYEALTPVNISGDSYTVHLWIAAMAAFGILIALNRFPRIFSLLSFFIMTAFMHRTPMIFFGADNLVRAMCLLSVFLPVGRVEGGRENGFCSGVSVAIYFQVVLVYFIAGWAKATSVWWDYPIASWLAMHGDQYASPFGRALLEYPKFLEVNTRLVLLVERFGWVALLIPWRNGLIRLFAILGFASMHIVFGMTLHIELFPYMDVVLLSILLPPVFWEKLSFLKSKFWIPSVPAKSFSHRWTMMSEPIAMFWIALLVWYSAAQMDVMRMPKKVRYWIEASGVNQSWELFAPYPYRDDGWYMAVGRTKDSYVELITGKPLPNGMTTERHHDLAARYPTYRFTPYLFRMRGGLYALEERFVNIFCDRWNNAEGNDRVELVDLYFVSEYTPNPGQEFKRVQQLRRRQVCPGTPQTPIEHLLSLMHPERKASSEAP